jgi:transcriptional regulator of acetoin/glycerol metabolism
MAQHSNLLLLAEQIVAQAIGSDDPCAAVEERLPLLRMSRAERLGKTILTPGKSVDSDLVATLGISRDDRLLNADTDALLLMHALLGESAIVRRTREELGQVLQGRRSCVVLVGARGTGKTTLLNVILDRMSSRRPAKLVSVIAGDAIPVELEPEKVVLGIDDVDHLTTAALRRLGGISEDRHARLVLTCSPEGTERLGGHLRHLDRLDRIRIPSLADRAQDIPAIAEAMAVAMHRQLGRSGLPPDLDAVEGAVSRLTRATWPDNLIGLRAALDAAFRSDDWRFLALDGNGVGGGIPLPASRADLDQLVPLDEVVRRYVTAVQAVTLSKTETAKLCGWEGPGGRNTVTRWLEGRGVV